MGCPRIGPDAEVDEFATDFLGPLASRVGEEWEVLVRLTGLAGRC